MRVSANAVPTNKNFTFEMSTLGTFAKVNDKEPLSGGTAFMITVTSTPGKYEVWVRFQFFYICDVEVSFARSRAKLAQSTLKCLNQISEREQSSSQARRSVKRKETYEERLLLL